jgi:F0F1-type ATP synthase assembly protein I
MYTVMFISMCLAFILDRLTNFHDFALIVFCLILFILAVKHGAFDFGD